MKTEKLNALKEFDKQRPKLEKEAVKELNDNLKDVFVKHPTLKSITIGVNNHEFNDGNPTEFSLYHEDLEITVSNKTIYRFDPDADDKDYDNSKHPIIKDVYDVFNTFEGVGSVLELAFGYADEKIVLKRAAYLKK